MIKGSKRALRLRNRIVGALRIQGFSVNPHLKPMGNDKSTLQKIHNQKKDEATACHKRFLKENLDRVKRYALDGSEIQPSRIDLELIPVDKDSSKAVLFLWWNLIWWSLPYTRPVGRQMRFILWDRYHNAPFGLIGLQSPPLKCKVRDAFLGLRRDTADLMINQSLYANRIGALPPYNVLLGAKMVALSLTCNEIREAYRKKYEDRETILKRRKIPNRLLFTTTTGAYGKSSVYERIAYKGEAVCLFLGYTAGSGTFHIPQPIYEEILDFLQSEGINTRRGYGTGPSRKLKLVSQGLARLGIGSYEFHNIRRGHYLFPNVGNLEEVVTNCALPRWFNRPFEELHCFWKKRWCIPRSQRIRKWIPFSAEKYFAAAERYLDSLN